MPDRDLDLDALRNSARVLGVGGYDRMRLSLHEVVALIDRVERAEAALREIAERDESGLWHPEHGELGRIARAALEPTDGEGA